MKYLFTFAVVSGSLKAKLESILINAPPYYQDEQIVPDEVFDEARVRFIDEKPIVIPLEESLFKALREDIDSVAFFRCVMDGWDATHEMLSGWFSDNRAAGYKLWGDYVVRGIVTISPQETQLFLPRPNRRAVEKFCQKHALNAYAIRAVLEAFYDAIDFVTATKATLIATASHLGLSQSDDEFQ